MYRAGPALEVIALGTLLGHATSMSWEAQTEGLEGRFLSMPEDAMERMLCLPGDWPTGGGLKE